MVENGEVECVRVSRGSGNLAGGQITGSQAAPGQCSSPYLLPWVGLCFPVPPKSGEQDILLETPLYSYVKEAERRATVRVPTVWQLAALAEGVAPLHVSKEVCWCSGCDF